MKNIYSIILFSALKLFQYFLFPLTFISLGVMVWDYFLLDMSQFDDPGEYMDKNFIISMLFLVLYLIWKIGREDWKNDWEYKNGEIGLGRFVLIVLGIFSFFAIAEMILSKLP